MSKSIASMFLLQLEIGHEMPGAPRLFLDLGVEAATGRVSGTGIFYDGAGNRTSIPGIVGQRHQLGKSGIYLWDWSIELSSEALVGFEASMTLTAQYEGLCTYQVAGSGPFYNQPVDSLQGESTGDEADDVDDGRIHGGWTTYSTQIDGEARKVFEAATANLMGVSYEPVAVATQLVAGWNYGFFCNAKVVAPNSINQAVMVYIHQPLPGQGNPVVVNIERVPGFRYGN